MGKEESISGDKKGQSLSKKIIFLGIVFLLIGLGIVGALTITNIFPAVTNLGGIL